jgi:hypothetical protein
VDRRKDHSQRAGYPTSYEEYKGSVQEENEDRAFLEFDKKHGNEYNKDHILIVEGVVVIACIAAVIAVLTWVTLF